MGELSLRPAHKALARFRAAARAEDVVLAAVSLADAVEVLDVDVLRAARRGL